MSKTAIIIGGSTGIGKELVTLFSQIDAHVYSFARSHQNSVVSNVSTITLDLNSHTLKNDFENIMENVTSIDYLINNAGAIVVKPFLELTREDISKTYQVNVMSIMEIIQVCLPKMKKGSHIVNISSIGGFQGSIKFPGLAAYSTSKAALVSLTEMLAEEFKETGIAINCLCLGAVQTDMLNKAFPGYQAPHTAIEMAQFIFQFTLEQGNYFHGKIIPVSKTTP